MRRLWTVPAFAVLVLFASNGCAADFGPSDGFAGSAGDVPEFTGPWASEFADTYRAGSDIVRAILEDGAISDAEWAETSDAFIGCMQDRGVRATLDDAYGAIALPDMPKPDAASDAALDACTPDFYAVSSLRRDLARNPDARDEDAIIAACLVEAGLVEPGYSGEDLASDAKQESLPFDNDDPVFGSCIRDPLGLLE